MSTQPSETQQIDPLRRVFVPVEKVTAAGTTVFCTSDREVYVRLSDGSIRNSRKKINGKDVRKARTAARRMSQLVYDPMKVAQ